MSQAWKEDVHASHKIVDKQFLSCLDGLLLKT